MKKLPDFGLAVCKRRIRHSLHSPALRPALQILLALMIYGSGVLACSLLLPISLATLTLPTLLSAAELCATLLTCLIGAFFARKYVIITKLPPWLPSSRLAVLCGLLGALGSDAVQSSLFFQSGPTWPNLAIFLPLALICATSGNLLANRTTASLLIDALEWLMLAMASVSAGLISQTLALTSLPMALLFGAGLAFGNVCGSSVLACILLRRLPQPKGRTIFLLAPASGALMTMLFYAIPVMQSA